jgi:hypothetical protein
MENRKTMRALKAIVALALFPAILLAQNPAKKSLEGVWKIAESEFMGADTSKISNPQPSLIIFGPKYYSMMMVPGEKPRALFKGLNPTNEEKISAFDSFFAQSGTYDVAGSVLTVHPVVAKNPNYMSGGFIKYQFRLDGNTLWLTSKSTDLNFRIGDKVVSSTAPPSESRVKLVRVE